MANVHSFAWFPEEHEEFIAYLAADASIWARPASKSDASANVAPAPVAEFFAALQQCAGGARYLSAYVGKREAIEHPCLTEVKRTVGGQLVPVTQNGVVMPGVSRIVGGTMAKYRSVNMWESEYLDYRFGRLIDQAELAVSNIFFYSSYLRGREFVKKSPDFLRWGKKVLGWVRRRTTASVPIARCNYNAACTPRVAQAHSGGLVVAN